MAQNFSEAPSHLLLHLKDPFCLLLAQESLHDSCRGAVVAVIVRLYAGGRSKDINVVDPLALHNFTLGFVVEYHQVFLIQVVLMAEFWLQIHCRQ